MRKSRESHCISNTFLTILFVIISFFVFYPLLYLVAGAFAPGHSIADMDLNPFSKGITLAHFKYLFIDTKYGVWFLNTLKIAVATSIITVFVTSLSAYVFPRFRFELKKPLMMSLLIL